MGTTRGSSNPSPGAASPCLHGSRWSWRCEVRRRALPALRLHALVPSSCEGSALPPARDSQVRLPWLQTWSTWPRAGRAKFAQVGPDAALSRAAGSEGPGPVDQGRRCEVRPHLPRCARGRSVVARSGGNRLQPEDSRQPDSSWGPALAADVTIPRALPNRLLGPAGAACSLRTAGRRAEEARCREKAGRGKERAK